MKIKNIKCVSIREVLRKETKSGRRIEMIKPLPICSRPPLRATIFN